MQARTPIAAALTILLGAGCGGDDEQLPPVGDAAPDGAVIDAPAVDAAADAALDAAVDAPDATTALPDLAPDQARMTNTVLVQDQFFAAGACELLEGCIGAAGTRRLLRFTTVSSNLGEGDVYLGPPSQHPGFEYSTCHGHYHLTGFAEYTLVGATGAAITGHKQAFCLLDSVQIDSQKPSHGYGCANQGISAGWADVYARSLPCQWIDITGVAPGAYTLRIELNPDGVIAETDMSNNVLEIPVVF